MAEDASETGGALSVEIFATPRRIALFAAATLAACAILFPLWYASSVPVSQAAGWVAARAIEAIGPVDRARATPRDGRLEIEVVPDATLRYRERLASGASFEVAVNALKHTVGLPFFLALALAAGPRRPARILAASALLVVLAGLGIACEAALGFATVAVPGGSRLFQPGVMQATALALGYQAATLLVPTLAPIALWLWARSGRPVPAQVE